MTDVEKLLCEYGGTKQRIKELELQIEELEAKKKGIYDKLLSTKFLKGDRVQGGPLYDPVVEAVSKLVDVYAERIRKLAADLAAANSKLTQIEDLVNKAGLTETELRYVRLRYFEGTAAWKVAQELGYCEKQAYVYKNRALKKLAVKNKYKNIKFLY